MAASGREKLRAVTTFDALIEYLKEDLDWPIEDADLGALTFDYEPEELGIDATVAAKISRIRQLRPLEHNQPWGIFFVEFERKRLPVVALRRILNSLVIRKRASANSEERAAWQTDDLLFISNYGEGDERQINLAHFSQDECGRGLPTLRVLGWDSQDTPLHLEDAADKLKTYLSWPTDPKDSDKWRDTWSSAFTLKPREVIATASELAERLAELARAIRDRINTVLTIETQTGPVRVMMRAFQTSLLQDLDDDGFADMYAQTVAYGLLSARIANVSSSPAGGSVVTTPFLKELLEAFLNVDRRGGQPNSISINFDELGVNDVAELLNRRNIEAVVRDFGDHRPSEDPVIHFYEDFLSRYDNEQKVSRGVFFTPIPVVSFIVRSVDELLRSEFELKDGLADTTTWGELAQRHEGFRIPDGVSPDAPFVRILDPATGTGTFLVETIGLIHSTLTEKWRAQGRNNHEIRQLWKDYVPAQLLPRLHGYELLMAPYAIAHVKVGLKLHETGYRFGGDDRVRVYLTNSLEPAQDFSGRFDFAIPALAHETESVNRIKRSEHFTVIMGNPPYANYSANLSPQARRIVNKYRNFKGNRIRERNQLQFERNLQDDFVKFLSFGEAAVLASGYGILSYITNASMLASSSLRGMREHLVSTFPSIFELNLHGGVNERLVNSEDDANVFDISQSVAIHAYARPPETRPSQVHYAALIGKRSVKNAALMSGTLHSLDWREIQPDQENCSFLPQDQDSSLARKRLDSIFVQFGAGIKTNRDAIAISFEEGILIASVAQFDPELAVGRQHRRYVHSLLYRPFDVRFVFYHQNVVFSRSLPTMRHMIGGPNIGIIASSTWTTPDRFSVNVSRLMVEMKTGTHDRGTTLFPIYRYEGILDTSPRQVHNFTPEFVDEWSAITGTHFLAVGRGDLENTSGPEDVLDWLYALFHAPAYRTRFRAALAQGFPIVLLPTNIKLLKQLASIGARLGALHLMESASLGEHITTLVGTGKFQVEKVSYSDETVWIDHAKTRGFRGVPEKVWNFFVGGYPISQKWLRDRQPKRGRNPSPGRVLTSEDIDHYQKIVVALNETIRIMAEIDEVIEQHGGWPAAFVAGKEPDDG